MKKQESFLETFPVNGHPTKTAMTFAFHTFSEEEKLYCKVLTIDENVPEFIFKFDRGAWKLQDYNKMPEWFISSEMDQGIDSFLLDRMNEVNEP